MIRRKPVTECLNAASCSKLIGIYDFTFSLEECLQHSLPGVYLLKQFIWHSFLQLHLQTAIINK